MELVKIVEEVLTSLGYVVIENPTVFDTEATMFQKDEAVATIHQIKNTVYVSLHDNMRSQEICAPGFDFEVTAWGINFDGHPSINWGDEGNALEVMVALNQRMIKQSNSVSSTR